jgi:cytochrome c-type biogenesis protein CcmH
MMLWIAILLVLAGALVAVFWPLLRKKSARTVLDHAILQHQAREAELARQYAAGLISEQEYKAATLEQARHLLALQARYEGREAQPASTRSIPQRKMAAALVLIGVPVLALPLYMRLGQPTLPDRPLAVRMAEAKSTGLNVEDALTKLEAHLLAKVLRSSPRFTCGWSALSMPPMPMAGLSRFWGKRRIDWRLGAKASWPQQVG